ncbi:helix-turn-helix transcriptional regulator [Paenibacillus sp. Z6-24]
MSISLNDAEQLAIARKRKKLSQGQLARQIGSYQTRISRLENSRSEPTADEKALIEKILGTRIWSVTVS